jgi:hypothetical protein
MFVSARLSSAEMIYNVVNDTVDQNGWDLTGTITTDGTIGMLSGIQFDLTISNGVSSYELTSFTYGQGGDLYPFRARATSLAIVDGAFLQSTGSIRLGFQHCRGITQTIDSMAFNSRADPSFMRDRRQALALRAPIGPLPRLP